MNGAGERGKRKGVLKRYRTENNKLNGNKINETGYKWVWERTTIVIRWKLKNMNGIDNVETEKRRTSVRFYKALRYLNLGWVVCHSDLYCDPAQPL